MDILSDSNFNSNNTTNTIKLLSPARQFVDQHYIQAASVLRAGGRTLDRIYIGNNNNSCLAPSCSNNSTVDFSLNAFKASPVLDLEGVDKLPAAPGGLLDECGVRTAIHPSGVIYTVFYKIISLGTTEDVVNVMVVRDDHWASNTKRFEDLKQMPSREIGQPVATNVIVPVVDPDPNPTNCPQRINCLGTNRH